MSPRATLIAVCVSLALFTAALWLGVRAVSPAGIASSGGYSPDRSQSDGAAAGSSPGGAHPGAGSSGQGPGASPGPHGRGPGTASHAGTSPGAGPGGPPRGAAASPGGRTSTAAGTDGRSGAGSGTGPGTLIIALEDANHRPVKNGAIVLSAPSRPPVSSTTTAGGTAVFKQLPAAGYLVSIEASGFPALRSRHPIALAAGEEKEARFALRPHDRTIAGRVLSPEGNPIAGVSVEASPMERPQEADLVRVVDTPSVRSNAEGKFIINNLADGEYLVETLPFEIYPSARRNVIAPAEGVDLALFLEKEISFSGLITDDRSAPLSDAEVSISPPGAGMSTARDGRFNLGVKIKSTPGSGVSISARKDGYTTVEKYLLLEEMKEEKEVEVNLQLLPEKDTAAVAGTVRDPAGTAIGGEKIYLHSSQLNAQYSALSGADGVFEFPSVRIGSDYRLYVYPQQSFQDKSVSPLHIEAGVNRQDLVLEPIEQGVLNGTLLDAAGAPVPRFTLWVRGLQSLGNSQSVSTDDTGRFRIEGVPAGELLIETRALPKISVRGIRIAAEQETSAEIRIGVGKSAVKGVVAGADGAAAAGIRVFLTWSGQQGSLQSSLFQEAVSDADGRFSMTGIGAGSCTVYVNAAGYKQFKQSIDLAAGASPELRIDLEK